MGDSMDPNATQVTPSVDSTDGVYSSWDMFWNSLSANPIYGGVASGIGVVGDGVASAGNSVASTVTDAASSVADAVKSALPSQTTVILWVVVIIVILFLIAYITHEVA